MVYKNLFDRKEVYVLYPSIKLVLLSHINEKCAYSLMLKKHVALEECFPDKYD